jgi:hypothetical protein
LDRPRNRRLRFKDDGLFPNHPRWPSLLYERTVKLWAAFDPAAVFEVSLKFEMRDAILSDRNEFAIDTPKKIVMPI